MDTSTENLVDALAIIKQLSYTLRKNIDDDNYEEVLATTILLLNELKNGALSPKDYYEIWIAICDNLISVESYFCQLLSAGMDGQEMYEQVQYTQAFVPRLYLMILVGSCCIRMKIIPAKKIIYDTLEMCKGIQHPMRGLFLRNFFIREMKDKFPYPGCFCEMEEGGDINDSVDCILRNFVEMNRLWIRIQSGKARDKEVRENERRDLKVLVGSNFVCLSLLDGIDADYYSSRILPAIVNEIISCGDAIAQEYLTESLICVFPEDFHVVGLPNTLECLCHLDGAVGIKNLFAQLLDRIQGSNKEEVTEEIYSTITNAVFSFIKELKDKGTTLPLGSLLAVENCSLTFIMKNKEDSLNDCDKLFSLTLAYLSDIVIESANCSSELIELFVQPIKKYGISIVNASSYISLFRTLSVEEMSVVATTLANSCLESKQKLTKSSSIECILELLRTLYIRDDIASQYLFSRCLHLISMEDISTEIDILFSLFTTILEASGPFRPLPLLTILYRLIASIPLMPQDHIYSMLRTLLIQFLSVNEKFAIRAILDVCIVADARSDTDRVKEYMEMVLTKYVTIQDKYRMEVSEMIISTILTIHNLPADAVKGFAEQFSGIVPENDANGRVISYMQSAKLYGIKTSTGFIQDENKTKEFLEKAKSVDCKLSSKEKVAMKALLLRLMIGVNMCCDSLVSMETLTTMFKEISTSEKISRSTKKVLEELKVMLVF